MLDSAAKIENNSETTKQIAVFPIFFGRYLLLLNICNAKDRVNLRIPP